MTMSNNIGQFGDTTLTKVFVGGLAWETPKEAMREHFEKYGEILEAVIISDKLTGRSKGYGFVTFKDAEAAKRACEDATPTINGRRANCNLASLGARRPRSSATPPPPPPQQGSNLGTRSMSPATTGQIQWYYPAGTPAAPFHHQHHHQPIPFYGYSSPAYIATDVTYNHVDLPPVMSLRGHLLLISAELKPREEVTPNKNMKSKILNHGENMLLNGVES
ncbi:hypothetical protein SLEP1_g5595 [Rubroshorea leprosula]|uniref:RRM domain-containing protein n=1 Tax=Rubroshorea leprosula TaxID=152421 RepID=A0AAV5HSR8_9ROSI|nr:hypothetical protein SLEP1_g5595 [Rubroshorea leprosula]